MSALPKDASSVLEYWFGTVDLAADAIPSTTKLWFGGGPAVDDEIRQRFGALIESAGTGKIDDWAETPKGALALIVLLDQFTRNVFRGTPKSFAFDRKAREIAKAAIERGHDRACPAIMRTFFYLPLEHSEDLGDQNASVEKMRAAAETTSGELRKFMDMGVDYAIRHQRIIERFQRFPHRNAILGRESTAEELAFLKEPGSSF
jgi:uncharacterized protein (DUF924 family)